jgi:hypothetical protein
MSAMSRDKGARGERAVVQHLRNNGWPDARRYLAGDGRQPGDIDAIPGVSIEVKNAGTYTISQWVAQAVEEAGDRLPVVFMHPKGVRLDDVGNWWAVMRVDDLLPLLQGDT